jgi:large subunit ribosomal protein L15
MQLNTLQRKHENKAKRPRVGRGGKRGTTAGKGTKGQKARSGHRIRPAIRDLIQRLPKLRGYANKPVTTASAVISVRDLGKVKAATVNLKSLIESGLVRPSVSVVKILSNGEVTKAIAVEGLKVSAGAKAKIEKAGGKVS